MALKETTATLLAATLAISASAATTTFNQTSNTDWNDSANWDNDIPGTPAGEVIDAIIASGKTAIVDSSLTPTYTGNLTLQSNAEVDIRWTDPEDLNALGTGTITLNTDSTLRIRRAGSFTLANNIDFSGDALIQNSSNTTDNKSRTFNGVISGSGEFTYGMRRGNLLALGGGSANTHDGGMIFNYSDNNFGNTSRVRADKNGAFGTGDVTINDGIYLELINAAVTDAISDSATLFLNGRGEHAGDDEKVTLGAGVTETVGGLVYTDWVSGSAVQVSLANGTYGDGLNNPTYTATLGGPVIPLFDGTGTLTIVPEPSSLALLGLGGLLIARRRRG